MKNINITFLLTILMSMVGAKVSAYDIAVTNEDGITLYYNYINDGTELEVTSGGTYAPAGFVRIPEFVTYMNRTRKVTSISSSAFRGNSYVTNVIIPSGVTTIGSSTFRDCAGLTSIDIPDNVIEIGAWAFCGCKNLAEIRIGTGVKRIGGYSMLGVFEYCTKLKKVIIKDLSAYCSAEITEIASSPFRYGAKL